MRPQRPRADPRGGGGGGYAQRSIANYPQNPSYPSAAGYVQNPAIMNPQFSNPYYAPVQFQFANYAQPFNPYINNAPPPPPPPPPPNPGPNREEVMAKAEAAAMRAHCELVSSGESVSSWKVSQAALIHLQLDSWSSFGIQLQEVPSLKRLLATESKISAFIHCFVGARKITSLYDLEMAICSNEAITRFEELGMGPLYRHPLVLHYFSIPSNATEVFKITSEDIIACLQMFMNKCKSKMIIVEEFLGYLSEHFSVSVRERLGVRIQSLGLHVSYIRKAWTSENSTLTQSAGVLGFDGSKNVIGRNSSQPSNICEQKLVLDKRIGSISDRIKSFTSAHKEFAGKHTQFIYSSDDDVDENIHADQEGHNGHLSHVNDNVPRISSCPYPSTTEEMARLGIKSEIHQTEVSNDSETMINGMKSSGKKGKFEGKPNKVINRNEEGEIMENETRSSGKKRYFEGKAKKVRDKKRKYEEKAKKKPFGRKMKIKAKIFHRLLEKNEVTTKVNCKKYGGLGLTDIDLQQFVTIWKEACQGNSLTEVLMRMLNFYVPTANQKKRELKMFSSYPGVGLLNVAVASIKYGLFSGLYDSLQDLDEYGSMDPDQTEMLEIGPPVKNNSGGNTNESIDKLDVSVGAIIGKIVDFFDAAEFTSAETDSFLQRWLYCMKKFHSCESWLANQFSVMEFTSLGHGNFCDFFDDHASVFPTGLLDFLLKGIKLESSVQVCMLERELEVILLQAQNNLVDSESISRHGLSLLLNKQFPAVSFCILGNEPENYFSQLTKGEKHRRNAYSILFSSTLVGRYQSRNLPTYSEMPSLKGADFNKFGIPSSIGASLSGDAMERLLSAPMLADLLSWLHWDIIYAPSFGPLMDWLLNNVVNKELLCIATIDGKLIKIDPSATLDEFLEAMVNRSSYRVALNLLSLLCLYGGAKNIPLSLLKCYVQRAYDVLIRNLEYSQSIKVEKGLCPSFAQANDANGSNFIDETERNSESSKKEGAVLGSLSRINLSISAISRFILECLGHLPSEFWCFAADILISGLRSFTKDGPMILLQCSKISERIMLHEIGLFLGITEWIEDYHVFCTSETTDLCIFAKTPCESIHFSCIEKKQTVGISNSNSSTADFKLDTVDASIEDKQLCKSYSATVLADDFCKPCEEPCKMDYDMEISHAELNTTNNQKLQEATLVVNSIRRDEFGLDSNLSSADSCMLKKQHARLGRALHCLSQELYSQDSHFLLELVQNADDNLYSESVDPTLVFILQDSGITVLNNEQGFSVQNIKALCDIGNSTKKGKAAGYIGNKGIGFKSVFRVTDAPEIHSNGFHVKFDITEGQIGFVLPTIVPPYDIDMLRQMLSGEDYGCNGSSWNTCIILPFRSKFKESSGMSSIISMFSDLHPSLLLFLHKLQRIKFRNTLDGTLINMEKEMLSDGIVRVSCGREKMFWLVVSKKLKACIVRPDVESTEIAIAFTLLESVNGQYSPLLRQQPVFSFLPLRNYGLKFIIQGDFVLPSSREEVDEDSAWNQWLLSEFPSLFVDAEQSFCSLACFQNYPGKAITAFLSFIPLDGEVHGFFSYLPYMIISRLRVSKCLLLDGSKPEWVLPCKVLRGWNEQVRLLISDSLLQKHLGLGYLHQDVVLSDTLAKALGVQEYGPQTLVDIMLAFCCKNDDFTSTSLNWLSSWLSMLYSALQAHSTLCPRNTVLEQDVLRSLKGIPFIPLSDGSYSSIADGPIWFPCDVFCVGLEGKQSLKVFPNLYAKLRIVSPLLFHVTFTSNGDAGDAGTDFLRKMLHKFGVQELSAHEIIRRHILVSLCMDQHSDEYRSLMLEYLAFIMLHFQYECAVCCTEKAEIISELRNKSILLTNYGFRSSGTEPIHFGREYGNFIDISKFVCPVDITWLEIDGTYLEHQSTQLLPHALTKWREFFIELGVTDFVQVNCVNKTLSDVLGTTSGNLSCADVILTSSQVSDWESPEFMKLVSVFSSNCEYNSCIHLLEVLDKLWDVCYSAKTRILFDSCILGDKMTIASSFMRSMYEQTWIASSLDKELHKPNDLFHDCEDIRSVLGMMAPYAVPKVTSKSLLKDIGFKTQATFDDALAVLCTWRKSNATLMASISQMSKFYTLIFHGASASNADIFKEFISTAFIYIPYALKCGLHDTVLGMFLSPKELFWFDPTGCLERIAELVLDSKSNVLKMRHSKALGNIYPSLHDFFVNICGVPRVPSFTSHLDILLELATVALPSQGAYEVFRVFLKWGDDLDSGLLKHEEITEFKQRLLELEYTVLPALQDKWVSLHPSFGLICWSDDEVVLQQFKNSDTVHCLQFGEISLKEKEMLSGKVANLLQVIGVPPLSKVVSREAIIYGTADSSEKASLINWVLPFAQRYLYTLYYDTYMKLKQIWFEKLRSLQVVVVEKLFYKYTLNGQDSTSKKRFECNCLLQGNMLYVSRSSDMHSIFLELSRYFFDGSSELHIANFLHMITTMVESGSTGEQIEFFISNSQKVPRLPDDETIWSVSCLFESQGQPSVSSLMNTNPHMPIYRRRPAISANWPPTGWKSAPDTDYAWKHHIPTAPGTAVSAILQNEVSNLPEGVTEADLPVSIEIDASWVVEEGWLTSGESGLQESMADVQAPHASLEHIIKPIEPENKSIVTFDDSLVSPELDTLFLPVPSEHWRTGRLGEMLAYKHFRDTLGTTKVRWVNQETETGLPYDLVINGDREGCTEYIEVKATKSVKKNWFFISMREWQFAMNKGESFSIAYVTLPASKKAKVTILRNPMKLWQQKGVHLAVMMAKYIKDSSDEMC